MWQYDSVTWKKEIEEICMEDFPWEQLRNRSIMIVGATGLIGRCMIDILMCKNRQEQLNCKVIAVSRSRKKAIQYFPKEYFTSTNFCYIEHDITKECEHLDIQKVDYILHMASNTHPIAYASKPIDTIVTNVYGTNNLLKLGVRCGMQRFVFLSSVEIYGENKGDIEKFDENYMGILNSNTLRAGYPESKRVGEALCQAYIKEKQMDAVIVRLPRVFGPTMLEEDSKAVAQFIKKAIGGENIVLKSNGKQYYSFLYVIDAVMGIFSVMLKGECGEAYNMADEICDATLGEMASYAAKYGNSKVVYEVPDENEKAGYSVATKARLTNGKVLKLGWKAQYSAERGVRNTIKVLREVSI